MEGRDLIVIKVGRDVGLCRIGLWYDFDKFLADRTMIQPLRVRGKIFTHRSHDEGIRSQKL